jgi:hypothetical protein
MEKQGSKATGDYKPHKPRILHLDIEISPVLVTVWGLFGNRFINPQNIQGNSEVLTWAALWDGDDKVLYDNLAQSTKREMITQIHELIDQADVVVTYNGNKFDLKILNKEFLELGLPPPAPYISVDLLATMRKNFRFTSNKMDYVCEALGLPTKKDHRGHQMWLDCMAGKKSAFREMSEYNVQDVVMLEALYERVKPWIKGVNYSIFEQDLVCPYCGGHHYQHRGYRETKAGIYKRYQCTNKRCGGWFRGHATLAQAEKFLPI